ncbi:MAG: PQQ-binding-like beta-propeller repeat protein, partial [bacterium]|nr:PQQ-binding-like beta-propeller repeat protein [bacterium]
MPSPKEGRVGGWYVSAVLVAIVAIAYAMTMVPLWPHVFLPDATGELGTGYPYTVPLDPESPWPKFRANALQNGRSPTQPVVNPALRPWRFETGKGIFSSGVVDAEGTVYIGSADQYFYAINRDGGLEWKFQTEEVIDSSALL